MRAARDGPDRRGGGRRFDLIVIGGGPAGSAAAITAAQAGLSVALLERSRFPRHRPGETLHPGVEPVLDRLGVADRVNAAGFLRHRGIRLRRGSSCEIQDYGADARGPWRGYQARRSLFDHLLLDRAREAGAQLCQPLAAEAPLIGASGALIGVTTPEGELEAPWTLDASGPAGWAARHLGLTQSLQSEPLIARYGYGFQPNCRDRTPTFQVGRNGWLWFAPIGDRLHHWCHVDFTQRRAEAEPPDLEADWRQISRVRGRDISWKRLDRVAGPGFLVAGDASATLDPSSSKGVLKALMTGMMAAHCVSALLRRGLPEPVVLDDYGHWLRDWHQADAREMCANYRKLGLAFPVLGPSLTSTSGLRYRESS